MARTIAWSCSCESIVRHPPWPTDPSQPCNPGVFFFLQPFFVILTPSQLARSGNSAGKGKILGMTEPWTKMLQLCHSVRSLSNQHTLMIAKGQL